MALKVSAGIGDEGEAGGMRLGKTIESERNNRLDDLLLRFRRNAIARHPFPQLYLYIAHSLLTALEAHGATHFLCLAAGETGSNHGHTKKLFLEQGNAKCPFQNRFQRRMRVNDRLASLPPR